MRQLLLAAAFVALCLLSLLLSPGYWREHMTFLLLAGGMSYACAALIARQLPALPLLLAGTLVIAVGTALTWRSSSVGRLGVVFPVQDSAAGYRELGAQLPAENVLGLVTEGTFFRDAGLAFPPGSLPMLTDRRTVNGFAAFVQPAYNDKLCLEYVALLEDCIRLWPSLFAPDPALNVTLADLMRLERIVVERGETLRRFERAAGQGWVVDRAGDSVVEFTRARPLSAQPGLLAWLPAGISARMKHLSIRAEEHELKFGVHLGGGIVVFQRAWYPGYRAWLDDVELDVFAHRGILLAVRLPENTQGRGTLRLRYQVPGFPGTLFVAAFGLGLGLLAPLLVPALARQERPA